jgi:hypothetical protein
MPRNTQARIMCLPCMSEYEGDITYGNRGISVSYQWLSWLRAEYDLDSKVI